MRGNLSRTPWETAKQAVLDIAWMAKEYRARGFHIHLFNDSATIPEDSKVSSFGRLYSIRTFNLEIDL